MSAQRGPATSAWAGSTRRPAVSTRVVSETARTRLMSAPSIPALLLYVHACVVRRPVGQGKTEHVQTRLRRRLPIEDELHVDGVEPQHRLSARRSELRH